jgi:hypothetical protein
VSGSTETSGRPADIPQDVWEAAAKWADEYARWLHAGNSTGVLSDHAEQGLTDTIARAIMAAKTEEREGCLSDLQAILDDLPSHDPGVCLDMAIRSIRNRGEG